MDRTGLLSLTLKTPRVFLYDKVWCTGVGQGIFLQGMQALQSALTTTASGANTDTSGTSGLTQLVNAAYDLLSSRAASPGDTLLAALTTNLGNKTGFLRPVALYITARLLSASFRHGFNT